MNTVFAVVLLVLYWPLVVAESFEAVVTGTTIDITYTEPVVNEDGSPLIDLQCTTIYYDRGEGPVVLESPKATNLSGGGEIAVTVTVPIGSGEEADVLLWSTATDIAGNEGPPGTIVERRIDRLAPGPPQ